MTSNRTEKTILRARSVQRSEHAVQVPVQGSPSDEVMTVVPLPGTGRIEGFEVRCRCGGRVVIECQAEDAIERSEEEPS